MTIQDTVIIMLTLISIAFLVLWYKQSNTIDRLDDQINDLLEDFDDREKVISTLTSSLLEEMADSTHLLLRLEKYEPNGPTDEDTARKAALDMRKSKELGEGLAALLLAEIRAEQGLPLTKEQSARLAEAAAKVDDTFAVADATTEPR